MFFEKEKSSQNDLFQSYASVISITISWITFYLILKCNITQSPEFVCRIVAFFHGSFTSIVGIYVYYLSQSREIENFPLLTFTLCNSLGYFLFDLMWCIYYQSETKLMIAHHVYSIVALSRLLFRDSWKISAVAGLGALEATNPLLQTRWFLRTLGYMKTPYYSIVEICFLTSFVCIRGIGGTLYVSSVVVSQVDLEIKIYAIIIQIISILFMINMFSFIKKRYFQIELMEFPIEQQETPCLCSGIHGTMLLQ